MKGENSFAMESVGWLPNKQTKKPQPFFLAFNTTRNVVHPSSCYQSLVDKSLDHITEEDIINYGVK